jgi:two-component system nitrogen regulation response regulator GlnG
MAVGTMSPGAYPAAATGADPMPSGAASIAGPGAPAVPSNGFAGNGAAALDPLVGAVGGRVFPAATAGVGPAGSASYDPAIGVRSGPLLGGAPRPGWAALLEAEVAQILSAQSARGGEPPSDSDVMDQLTRAFESTIIRTALRHTRGRRIDAALRLGIGRNTITRKIQDLRLEDD